MTPDEINELKELIEFLKEYDIGDFEFERGDFKIRLKFGQPVQAPPASALDIARLGQLLSPAGHTSPAQGIHAVASAGAAAAAEAPAAPVEEEKLHIVKSPIVGTFYESSSPGAPAFVKIGDTIEDGQVLCIVEAMKLMNEIESDAAGEVVKRWVTNGQPVEYGQHLFSLRLL
ncbi:MAG: acetyl-CoA carboxylase biotin carboxyl carrier protein [Acidobacteriaceae bacterium]